MKNDYECLIIVEGKFDRDTYSGFFENKKYKWYSANGKSCILDIEKKDRYQNSIVGIIEQFTILPSLKLILFIVDSDNEPETSFNDYIRSKNSSIRYINKPIIKNMGNYWIIDYIDGSYNEIPIYGVTVPHSDTGCLETELLNTYAYPTPYDKDYVELERIIRLTSNSWGILKDNGYDWFDNINHDARIDKFVYWAMYNGFKSVGKVPNLPPKPEFIHHIKEVLELP
jgi:hypothetical protein